MEAETAVLVITYNGQIGDLPDSILFDLPEDNIKQVASEAVSSGSVPGIDAIEADFSDFVVDRYVPSGDMNARILLRPKTSYGF